MINYQIQIIHNDNLYFRSFKSCEQLQNGSENYSYEESSFMLYGNEKNHLYAFGRFCFAREKTFMYVNGFKAPISSETCQTCGG